jgi:hypothetical protein
MKHWHHIIPKHMGGTDDPSNLIELTVEQHAEEHRKLYEKYGLEMEHVSKAIARDWKVIKPNEESILIHNMAQFCRENNLSRAGMSQGGTKGYRCEKLA